MLPATGHKQPHSRGVWIGFQTPTGPTAVKTFRYKFSAKSSEGFQASCGQQQSLSRRERKVQGYSVVLLGRTKTGETHHSCHFIILFKHQVFLSPPFLLSLFFLFVGFGFFFLQQRETTAKWDKLALHNQSLGKQRYCSRNWAKEIKFFLVWTTDNGRERNGLPQRNSRKAVAQRHSERSDMWRTSFQQSIQPLSTSAIKQMPSASSEINSDKNTAMGTDPAPKACSNNRGTAEWWRQTMSGSDGCWSNRATAARWNRSWVASGFGGSFGIKGFSTALIKMFHSVKLQGMEWCQTCAGGGRSVTSATDSLAAVEACESSKGLQFSQCPPPFPHNTQGHHGALL